MLERIKEEKRRKPALIPITPAVYSFPLVSSNCTMLETEEKVHLKGLKQKINPLQATNTIVAHALILFPSTSSASNIMPMSMQYNFLVCSFALIFRLTHLTFFSNPKNRRRNADHDLGA
ncbi:hypothetical protein ACSAZL_12590 [Methanosarcina sp. T3]|uniref:hypothetical protein n=1 Tax=Methanosarcina sp. T3 TaxID=3439062 RepID=UPI003F827A6D